MDTTSRPQPDPSPNVDHTSLHQAHRPSRRRDRATRRRLTALTLAVAAGVTPAAHTAAEVSAAPLGGCVLTSSGNSMTFDVTALLTTVRLVDGTVEMLHDVHCTDGRAGTVWIGSDIIPSTPPAHQHLDPSLPSPRPSAPGESDPPLLTAATDDLPGSPTA